MADSTTTRSAIVGCLNGGMQNGLFGSAGSPTMGDTIKTVYGSPQNVVTNSTGSQILYDVENDDIYCALGVVGGSSWNRLGSMT